MRTYTAEELQAILKAHVAWLWNEVNGERANFSGANFSFANFSGADLSFADLSGANFSGANFSGAYFSGAYLSGANLSGANLSRADLSFANFSGAYHLDGAIIPGGYTFATYKSDVVPALLTAGGKSLEDVVRASWDCHSWDNCPMAVAFDVHKVEDVPPLYREQARLFVQLFDAKLIPNPLGEPAAS